MPDLLTPQALAAAGPIVLETLIKHFLGPKSGPDKNKAKDDLMYDEAFTIVKTFLEIATKHPVAALQRFGQVRTPSPPWVALYHVLIPAYSLNAAAEFLIKAFGGEEMAYKIAGGTKWWQVRAGQGVEGEWIVMKKDWKEVVEVEKREREQRAKGAKTGNDHTADEDDGFRPEMDRLRCMLYIHGGAYYWGSINSHRYTIWRYARKMHGRCFAVNYRKAPQYPFPCAIHDCLAAYIYLTNPPPGAEHRPVDPKSIIIAGDSAGGGLVLALLQILRDTEGLELPAGAVLISPWSDLTHSFPSILENTATDIIPPYSFIHKPSSLWPPPPPVLTEQVQSRLRSRVREAVSRLQHGHGHSDPEDEHRYSADLQHVDSHVPTVGAPSHIPDKLKTSAPGGGLKQSDDQSESDLHPLADKGEAKHPEPHGEPTSKPCRANPAMIFQNLAQRSENETRPTTLAQCTTPLYLDVKGKQVEVDTQIQIYATNAQLCHPFVSPVLGYMGGLPPLYIECGDAEVLRDEIIYLAHKAAHPNDYPIREDVKAMLPSLQGIEKKHGPTDVHLQVYDGVCHVLPLFSMTKPSRGVFRAISSFARYVTPSAPGSLYISRSRYPTAGASIGDTIGDTIENNGFNTDKKSLPTTPIIGGSSSPTKKSLEITLTSEPAAMTPQSSTRTSQKPELDVVNLGEPVPIVESPVSSEPSHHTRLEASATKPDLNRDRSTVSSGSTPSGSSTPNNGLESLSFENRGEKAGSTQPSGDDAGPRFDEEIDGVDDSRAKKGEAGWPGVYRGPNPFNDHMIRERVSTTGVIRPLEPVTELSAFKMPADEIGFIKEGPAMRYLNGQALWDKKYRRVRERVEKKREMNLREARGEGRHLGKLWETKIHEGRGSVQAKNKGKEKLVRGKGKSATTQHEEESDEFEDDVDTNGEEEGEGEERNDILDQSWSWTWALNGEAPPPGAIVSRRDFAEARKLALMADRLDSVHSTPLHGLSIWVGLAAFFTNSSERNKATEMLKLANEEKKRESGETKGRNWLDDGDTTDGTDSGKRDKKGGKKVLNRLFSFGKKHE
ncbi:hypothetical protein CI109_101452 [Kwoniella shandongensis]|uniref:Uncharacterized protein n=1 Tax=Kwoniella shandongensis TaxID=1734106 RepID=A0A5M6BXD4_9TREE|nr:uncharacterized protein CI109_005148 [Kwoniella shandongensis]KAA5526572.1 hypothetical protein CI109_005148 [Kwoniella shandongensis]